MPQEAGNPPPAKENGQKEAPQRRLERATRPGGGEPMPGPSGASQRQGYCSCCQVFYSSLDQHLLSPRHREVVRNARSAIAVGSLMDRFLQDVMRHHPHYYNDTRPTHADLPFVTILPPPREVLSEIYCGSKGDRASVGTREEMPSSDEESTRPSSMQHKATSAPGKGMPPRTVQPSSSKLVDAPSTSAQPGLDTLKAVVNPPLSRKDSPTTGFLHRTSTASMHTVSQSRPLSKQTAKVSGQLGGGETQPSTEAERSKGATLDLPCDSPLQHRKAQRKTKRPVGESDSPSWSVEEAQLSLARLPSTKPLFPRKPVFESPTLWAPALPPWKGDHRERTFSETSDEINNVINEVIDFHCYGRVREQSKRVRDKSDDDDKESFHVSLHSMSNSTGSRRWDDDLQAGVGMRVAEDKNLAGLLETHITLEDQSYVNQLDSALKPTQEAGDAGAGVTAEDQMHANPIDSFLKPTQDPEVGGGGDWTVGRVRRNLDEVLPDLPHIPPSFVGKTWGQVMHEDDLKVDLLVREFRQGEFRCYFDTESLARYGRHRRRRKKARAKAHDTQTQDKTDEVAAADGTNIIPLTEHTEEVPDSPVQPVPPAAPEKEKTARPHKRAYRLASRCQVVKVSHGTQTTSISYPLIRRKMVQGADLPPEDAETSQGPGQSGDSNNATVKTKTRLCALRLPAIYSKVMTPLQPKTVVYVLSSPADPTPSTSKQPGRRRPGGGRKRKTADVETDHKLKYKRTPLKYYDPLTNRVLKSPPKGTPTTPNPLRQRHVRQLFRSLSPDNNKERFAVDFGVEPWGSLCGGLASSSVADLGASSTGSCFDSGGPSEPGSSQVSSSRRALFSRSSMSSGSRFLFGTLTPATSVADSSAAVVAACGSQTSGIDKVSLTSDPSAGRSRTNRKRHLRESTRCPSPAKKRASPSPTCKRRRKSSKAVTKRTTGKTVERMVQPCKIPESRTSPRIARAPTRTSPRSLSRTLSVVRP